LWLIIGASLIVIAVIVVIVLACNWPYTQQAVAKALQDRFARTVQIRSFRKTYFPPGCVAEGVSFLHRKRKDLPALITVQTLEMSVNGGRIEDLLSLFTEEKRLPMTGSINLRARVQVPPGPPGFLRKLNLAGSFKRETPTPARPSFSTIRWAKSSRQSSEILDQHRIGRFRAAREGQATVVGPVEIENLVRGEMRHRLRRAARHRLFPDVIRAIHAVDKRDGVAIGGPDGATTDGSGQREDLSGLAARERSYRQPDWLILAGNVQAGNPLAVWGDGRKQ